MSSKLVVQEPLLEQEELYLTILAASEESTLHEKETRIIQCPASCTFGRSSGVDVTLKDVSVSRRHVHLQRRDDRVIISNISTNNGVFVDGEDVPPGTSRAVTQRDAMQLQLGKVLLRLEWARQTQPYHDQIVYGEKSESPRAPTTEPLLKIVRDGDCCVVYCKGRCVSIKPSSALALYALGLHAGEIVHHWDIMDLMDREIDLAQAISGARRCLRELLEHGELDREEVIGAILETNADVQHAQLNGLDDASLTRQLIFSRRGHGYGLAIPPSMLVCEAE